MNAIDQQNTSPEVLSESESIACQVVDSSLSDLGCRLGEELEIGKKFIGSLGQNVVDNTSRRVAVDNFNPKGVYTRGIEEDPVKGTTKPILDAAVQSVIVGHIAGNLGQEYNGKVAGWTTLLTGVSSVIVGNERSKAPLTVDKYTGAVIGVGESAVAATASLVTGPMGFLVRQGVHKTDAGLISILGGSLAALGLWIKGVKMIGGLFGKEKDLDGKLEKENKLNRREKRKLKAALNKDTLGAVRTKLSGTRISEGFVSLSFLGFGNIDQHIDQQRLGDTPIVRDGKNAFKSTLDLIDDNASIAQIRKQFLKDLRELLASENIGGKLAEREKGVLVEHLSPGRHRTLQSMYGALGDVQIQALEISDLGGIINNLADDLPIDAEAFREVHSLVENDASVIAIRRQLMTDINMQIPTGFRQQGFGGLKSYLTAEIAGSTPASAVLAEVEAAMVSAPVVDGIVGLSAFIRQNPKENGNYRATIGLRDKESVTLTEMNKKALKDIFSNDTANQRNIYRMATTGIVIEAIPEGESTKIFFTIQYNRSSGEFTMRRSDESETNVMTSFAMG